MALIQLTLKSTDTDKTQIKKNKENYEKKDRRQSPPITANRRHRQLSLKFKLIAVSEAESRWEIEIKTEKILKGRPVSAFTLNSSPSADSFKKKKSIWGEGRGLQPGF